MFIVYKTVTQNVSYAMARRVRCDRCGDPYAYLVDGHESAQSVGLPLLSSDRRMNRSAFRSILRKLRGYIKRRRFGAGRCPRCHTYTKRMVRASRVWRSTVGLFVGSLVGFLVGLVVMGYAWIPYPRDDSELMAIGAALGAAIGMVVGYLVALDDKPRIGVDRGRSLTDDGLMDLIEASTESGSDPVGAWCAKVGVTPNPNATAVALGIRDETNELDFGEHASRHVIDEMYRAS